MNELDESTYGMLSSQLDNIVESSIDSADIQTFVSAVETKLLADGFKSEFSPMMKQWLKDTVKDFNLFIQSKGNIRTCELPKQ